MARTVPVRVVIEVTLISEEIDSGGNIARGGNPVELRRVLGPPDDS